MLLLLLLPFIMIIFTESLRATVEQRPTTGCHQFQPQPHSKYYNKFPLWFENQLFVCHLVFDNNGTAAEKKNKDILSLSRGEWKTRKNAVIPIFCMMTIIAGAHLFLRRLMLWRVPLPSVLVCVWVTVGRLIMSSAQSFAIMHAGRVPAYDSTKSRIRKLSVFIRRLIRT